MKKKISFRNYPILFLSVILLLFFLFMLLTNRFLYAPKILLLCILVLVSVFLGKQKILINDWFVFLSFVYLSDTMRGLIYFFTCKFQTPVYTLYAMNWERFLFGGIPTVSLQQSLLKEDNFTWLEKSLTVLHGTHFIAFLFVGLIIWLQKTEKFQAYKKSFYLLISMGLSIYIFVPTVPPWIASEYLKILPKLTHFNVVLYNMIIPDLTTGFNTNPIGAMPSLHTAFPMLACLLLWQLYRWKAIPFYLYTLSIMFSIVYSSDHYIVDLIAGILLAVISYWITFHGKAALIKIGVLKEREPKEKKDTWFRRQKQLILGLIILAIGFTSGRAIKNTLANEYNLENLYIPNYVDFTKNKEDYRDNHAIQFYFGQHAMYLKKYDEAMTHFNRALELSTTPMEKRQVESQIKLCKKYMSERE
jgi:membrane-associated phospholipid phosphatase